MTFLLFLQRELYKTRLRAQSYAASTMPVCLNNRADVPDILSPLHGIRLPVMPYRKKFTRKFYPEEPQPEQIF